MEYKVGDKVKIKNGLVVGKKYGDIIFLESMAVNKGQEVTIRRLDDRGHFLINENMFWYSKEMLENTKKNGRVYLVAGVLNGTTQVLYWKCDISLIYNLGDYAIVENKQGYDLIKIVGAVETEKNKVKLFSHTKYEDMKSIVSIVNKEDMEVQK